MTGIDWAEVGTLATKLGSRASGELSVPRLKINAFAWNPLFSELPPPLPFLGAWWTALPRQHDLPAIAAIDPLSLRETMGYLMILEPQAGNTGVDFRYRLYGTAVAARSGFDLTGKRISVSAMDTAIKQYFLACYRAVMDRRQALFAAHEAPPDISVVAWSRLILPFAGADGAVERIVVGNIPGRKRPSADFPDPVYGTG